MRKSTRTSSFGSPSRENHDSSQYYGRKMNTELRGETKGTNEPYLENPLPAGVLDSVTLGDSRDMALIPDSSIHLMVTSPPYNVGKEYDSDVNLTEYLGLLGDVIEETFRVLVQGGRMCINIANIGRKPYIPLHSDVIQLALRAGFLMRGEIIWNKSAGAGTSTAWGSWLSASNPTLRDVHEYILVFSKGSYERPLKGKKSTISRDEFLDYTKSVWTFNPESARKVKHPAPFPEELPYRCIQLYTYQGDNVLDPFCGVGTTMVAAMRSKRHFIGFDNKAEYIDRAKDRINGLMQSNG